MALFIRIAGRMLWSALGFLVALVLAIGVIGGIQSLLGGRPSSAPPGALIAGIAGAYYAWRNPPKRLTGKAQVSASETPPASVERRE